MITDSFDHENGILLTFQSGMVTIIDFISWANAVTPERFPVKDLKLLITAIQTGYTFRDEHLPKLDKLVFDLCSRYETVKAARVHSTFFKPDITELERKRKFPSNITTRIFTDQTNAIEWLLEP